ncbi:MAG: bifunctional riboflavin kinase/FAD synthetase, partial [Bacteroidetes bacterium]
MRVFNRLDNLPAFRNAVITIGSFDGVHRGHQQLLARINRLAARVAGESVVITFHPHPRQVIYPKDDSLQLLNTIDEKIALFERFGVDNVVVVPFTVAFSQQSADEYIEKFLIAHFHPHTVVIGYDHRFGLNRQGDIHYLRYHGQRLGFRVDEIAPHEVDHMTVSSTKIRNALAKGDVAEAAKWLGYRYELSGTVVKGQRLGTLLGFPTANIQPSDPHKLIPGDGIYAVRGRWQDQKLEGMLYIGTRPSIQEVNQRVIELHIFDFKENIYRETISIEFVDYIRGDKQFASLDELKAQLQRDEEQVQARLQAAPQQLILSAQVPRLAIVILNYNGREYLEQFLPGVLHTTAVPGVSVVIADNASTDDSLSWLAVQHPELRVIKLAQNLGFAAGYNAALQEVDAEYYVLLNSDIEVAAGWWQPCLQALDGDPGLAAVQPKVRSYHRKDYFEYAGAAGGWLDYLGYPFCRGRIFATTEADEGQYDDPQEIFWASGAALFIRAELFHQIGGFDVDYFAHAEE